MPSTAFTCFSFSALSLFLIPLMPSLLFYHFSLSPSCRLYYSITFPYPPHAVSIILSLFLIPLMPSLLFYHFSLSPSCRLYYFITFPYPPHAVSIILSLFLIPLMPSLLFCHFSLSPSCRLYYFFLIADIFWWGSLWLYSLLTLLSFSRLSFGDVSSELLYVSAEALVLGITSATCLPDSADST